MKYYAVKQGRQTGIFTTWAEAEAQVKGFSGATFKSFTSLSEAKAYMEDSVNSNVSMATFGAFVDGSFNKDSQRYGSGVVIVKDDAVIEKLSFAGENANYIESYQIAGEVLAAIAAIEWAVQRQQKTLTIYYDYEGIRAWAVGEWRTNKPVSKDYKKHFDQLSQHIQVTFTKVKAHSGVTYNDMADELAKSAVF